MTTTKDMLSTAIAFAAKMHSGQFDKNGAPYILHPIRVMMAAQTDEQRQVAVMHDLIEDAGVTRDELLSMGFSVEVVDAIDTLSRKIDPATGKNELYLDQFIERIKYKPLARAVKMLDLKDNMDPARRPPGTHGQGFDSMLKKYQHALDKLEAVEKVERLERELKKAKELL